MKKNLVLLMASVVMILSFASCGQRPYATPIVEEIGPNETAFLVSLEGNAKDGQAKMDSLAFYEAAKVQSKRIEIPQRWMQTGRRDYQGKWIPTMKLIKVDRSPVTRLWYNESDKVGDKPGINVETKSSIGVTIGVSLSARIDEDQTAKFLYYYNLRPLSEVMDKEMYATTTSILGGVIGKMDYEEMVANKEKIVAALQDGLTKQYAQFGVTVYGIGLYRGIIPDNPDIQKSIDAKIIAENDRAAATAQVEAARIKSQMTAQTSAMADVAYKQALANYINSAAEKGIKLVPDVMSGNGGLLIDLSKK